MTAKTYLTTKTAGWRVAGRVIPAAPPEKDRPPRPLAGHPLMLTDAEAEYELRQGTIEPKPADPKATDKDAAESKAPVAPVVLMAPSKSG